MRVIYNDKNVGFVPNEAIGGLIEAGRIAAYCGPGGWVFLRHDHRCALDEGAEPIRKGDADMPVKRAGTFARGAEPCVLDMERVSICSRVACQWLCKRVTVNE